MRTQLRQRTKMLVHVWLHKQILHIVMAFAWHWKSLNSNADDMIMVSYARTKKKRFKFSVVQLCVAH